MAGAPGIPLGPEAPDQLPQGPEAPQSFDDLATTVEKAWWLFMQRIGKHNPRLYQDGGHALDGLNGLMRMR